MNTALAVSTIAVIVSSFSCGFSVAMYLTSEYRIKELVAKRLEKELSKRCEWYQRETEKSSISENDKALYIPPKM